MVRMERNSMLRIRVVSAAALVVAVLTGIASGSSAAEPDLECFGEPNALSRCKELAENGAWYPQFLLCEHGGMRNASAFAEFLPYCKLIASNNSTEARKVTGRFQVFLCQLYQNGGGPIRVDYREAFKWCQLADAQGEIGSLRDMFRAYDAGLGTGKDATEAYKYIELEIRHAKKDYPSGSAGADLFNAALAIRRDLELSLPNESIAEARRRADKWDQLHGSNK